MNKNNPHMNRREFLRKLGLGTGSAMALMALEIPVVKVMPQKWQKTYSLGRSSECGKSEWKNRLKARAQELFPDLGKKVTLKTCDALLIALYGVREMF